MSFYQCKCRGEIFAAKLQQFWGLITGNNYHMIKGRCKELLAVLHERIFVANLQQDN